MLLDIAVWAMAAFGFGIQGLTHPRRHEVRVLLAASLGTMGASCMLASFLFAHERVVSTLRAAAFVLFVGAIIFYILNLIRNR